MKRKIEKFEKSVNGEFLGWRYDINPPVFWGALGVVGGFVLLSVIDVRRTSRFMTLVQSVVSSHIGWFYILCMTFFLVFAIVLALSRFGNIRLGGADARPEFKYHNWFAMLFSAGMGIGLLFYSVAEPVLQYADPPTGMGIVNAPAQSAMNITFFHWGFHAWGVYSLVGLCLAFACFNLKLPLTIRSIFYPVLGNRIHGRLGDLIDMMAAVATLFGLATSLGLGVKQINAGFHHLFSLPVTYPVQLVLIIGITLIATVSVVLGLKAGVRRLSQLNMYFAFALLLFVLLAGPTLLLIRALIQNIGAYLCALPRLSLWTQAYDYQSAWMSQWTLFYWAWWIAWSPFVGMFIARISRGRTIREFLLGVLLVPSLVTFIWMTVFGNSAIAIDQAQTLNMVQAVREHIAVALFKLLSVFPLSQISSCLAVTVVTLFFVTSSDSASMVVDIITAGGNTDPPVWQRIFWAFLEGALAAVLLALGGIAALQMAAIIFGLPFSVIIMLMSFSLLKALRQTPPA